MSPAFDDTTGRMLRHVPNAITVIRGLLIPVIGALLLVERYVEGFWTLVASALSDLVAASGASLPAARWASRSGPDKLTMLTVTLVLAWQGLLPTWLAAAIVGRDVVIVSGALAYHRFVGRVEMAPTWLSKLNTVLEFVVLAAVIADAAALIDDRAWLPMLFAVLFVTVVTSGAQYVWIWGRRALAAAR
jgi:cardiolipin synthase